MSYASLMEIILIEDKVSKKPNPQGVLSQWKEARAIVRKEDGSVQTVGMFRVPKDLEPTVAVGLYQVGSARVKVVVALVMQPTAEYL